MDHPFVKNFDPEELETTAEFLMRWLPFMSEDLCKGCSANLRHRILSLTRAYSNPTNHVAPRGKDQDPKPPNLTTINKIVPSGWELHPEPSHPIPTNRMLPSGKDRDPKPSNSTSINKIVPSGWELHPEPSHPIPTNRMTPSGKNQDLEPSNSTLINKIVPSGWELHPEPSHPIPTNPFAPPGSSTISSDQIIPSGWEPDPIPEHSKRTWADKVEEEEDELEERESVGEKGKRKTELSKEQRLQIRVRSVKRKKDFFYEEKVRGKMVNILEGLELHEKVFNSNEQNRIVDFIYDLQEKGRRNELGDRTYSEPKKWMRGKGRVTIQFGCNYNYANDKDGNPPGIMKRVAADPIPSLFKVMIKRLVKWNVLPEDSVPDSCIVNIYEAEDCIPPHIDSHDFVRPFCTVSFLSECDILFGSNLKIVGQGEFDGPVRIPLPVGSVLVLNGNGADVAKHCVPAVPTKRISITFRKMDESKWPDGYSPEPDLKILGSDSKDSDSNSNFESRNGNQSKNSSFKTPSFRKPPIESSTVTTSNGRGSGGMERSSFDRNGEMRTPQNERSGLSRGNEEGMRALSIGSGRGSGGMERSSFERNGEMRTPQSERSGLGRGNEQGTRALSIGSNGSAHSQNSQDERSVFSRLNEGNIRYEQGTRALSIGSNGSAHSRNSQDERSVFSRLNEGNIRYGQSRNGFSRGGNTDNTDRW